MKRWPAIIISLSIIAAAGTFAWRQGESLFSAWISFEPPAAAPATSGETPTKGLSSRVLIVVVGGLREDAARRLPTLSWLAEVGAARMLTAVTPSEDLSAWSTILTGRPPSEHGVLSPLSLPALPGTTLFDQARSASLTTALAGTEPWGRLASAADLKVLETPDRQAEESALLEAALLQHGLTAARAKAGLALIYLNEPAATGALSGAAGADYLAATARADTALAHILAEVDLRQTTVIVTADHGLTDEGGKGGSEPPVLRVPLVAAGPGIAPGRYSPAQQEDLAPTVAALLGLPAPSLATGSLLTDMLAYPNQAQAQRSAHLHEQRVAAVLESQVREAGGVWALPPAVGTGLTGDADYLARAAQQVQEARRYQWWLDLRGRLPWAGGFSLVLILYLVLVSRQSYGRAALWGSLTYFGLYYLFFLGPWRWGPYAPLHSLNFSPSELGLAPYHPFLKQRALEAAAALLSAAALTGFLAGRHPSARRDQGAFTGLHLTMALISLLGLQALVFWAGFGAPFHWTLPPPRWVVKQGLDLVQVAALAAAAPLAAASAALAFRLAYRRPTEDLEENPSVPHGRRLAEEPPPRRRGGKGD